MLGELEAISWSFSFQQ